MHQVGTSSLLIYMMHGHTYIKLNFLLNLERVETKSESVSASLRG